MFLIRSLPLIVILIALSQLSRCELSEESSEKKSGNSFEKRQGFSAEDVPDQLAVESVHHDQLAVESEHQGVHHQQQPYAQTVPMPVTVQAFPGNVVLPMPPGFGPGQQGGPHGQLRGPMPQPNHGQQHQGPQGQFSQPQVSHQHPPPNFQQGGPPQGQFPPQQFQQQGSPPNQQHQQIPQFQQPPPQHFQQQQKQQQHHQQQLQQQSQQHQHQILQEQLKNKLPSGADILVQKANEINIPGQESRQQIHVVPHLQQQQFANQQHLHLLHQQNLAQQSQTQSQSHSHNLQQSQSQFHIQQAQLQQQLLQQQQLQEQQSNEQINIHPNHKPSGLVPPLPPSANAPQKFPNFERERPPPTRGFGSGESLTKNILRELFDRPKSHHGPHRGKGPHPNGGYFAPPPPPGQSHPKILNRPSAQQGIRPGGKEIAIATNDLNAEGGNSLPVQYGGLVGPNGAAAGPWPEGPDGDMPKIVSLEVKCEKNVMRVFIAFDKPFFGVIFSKGHYHNVHCIHLPAGLGHTSANFDISIDSCGTQGNTENGLYGYGVQSGSGSYFENVVVIQYDAQVQEVWDQARKLRCTWHDQYEKSVTFRPFPVDMLDVVRADFAGDNVGCWMQIQVGKGPWASEVSGLVKIGQTMTMVLAIKDDENKFDMLVRNCMAHDGNRAPIQLVDQWGCVTRPKLMSRFTKIKNFGNSASVLSYAHFQAFKFPDSMEVHFQCTIQICRHQCPEQCSNPGGTLASGGYAGVGKSGLASEASESNERRLEREGGSSTRRRRRSLEAVNATANATESDLPEDEDEVIEYTTTFKADLNEDVGLNKVITVVSPDDLDFSNNNNNNKNSESNEEGVPLIEASIGDIVCMSTFGFAAMLVLLIGMLLIACIISGVIIIKRSPNGVKKQF